MVEINSVILQDLIYQISIVVVEVDSLALVQNVYVIVLPLLVIPQPHQVQLLLPAIQPVLFI